MLSRKLFLAVIFSVVMVGVGLAQSQLPAAAPDGLKIYFHRDGGMSPSFRTVNIRGREMTCDGLKNDEKTRESCAVTLTESEHKKLYELFQKNNFDLIKNRPNKGVVFDAPVQRLRLEWAENNFDASMGGNYPLLGSDAAKFRQIAEAVESLADKYSKKK